MTNDMEILRVLVIDDVDRFRKMTVNIIESIGIDEVKSASDAKEAFKHCMDGRPDIILCDIQKNQMDGFDFVGRLCQLGKDFLSIPVVFTADNGNSVLVKKAKALNASGYLLKPFSPKKLYYILERILDGLWKN